MDFNTQLPEWKNEGTAPSDELKASGFQAGYKPPAGIFNWFWSKVSKAISELQTLLKGHAEDTNNPHGVTTAQLGLDKVNNTPDSEKSVSFASEAGVGRKVKYPLVVRLNGGKTEGTDLWTFDGAVSKSINLTPDKMGAAEMSHTHASGDVYHNNGDGTTDSLDDFIREAKAAFKPVAATSTDGVAYSAFVDGVTELYNGLTLTIVPSMTSTNKATTFDLNGLGAKNLRMSINGYNFGNSGTPAALAGWLGENSPVTIVYKAKFDNWQTVVGRPSISGMYGVVDIEQGGTGADNAEDARRSLGVAPAGYGLGEQTGRIVADANTAILAGFYGMSGEGAANLPTGYADFVYGALRVERRYNFIHHTLRHNNITAKRQSTNGGETWGQWEYVNPPMSAGTEYRTTERYLGKPVYVKLISFGALPNNTTKSVEHGIENISDFVEIKGIATTGVGGYAENISNLGVLSVYQRIVQVKTTSDNSGVNGYITLKYTKTS